MSFSTDVKGELSRLNTTKKCCMLAEIAGFLRVSGSVKLAGNGKFSIVASTEIASVARRYKQLLRDYFSINADIGIGDSRMPGRKGRNRYYLTITPDEKSEQILRETGIMLVKEGSDYLSDGIFSPIVKLRCCKRAYIRGLFMACGSVSDPRKRYGMEFVMESEQTANDLKKLIGTFRDLSANITTRKNSHIVYIKKIQYISDMLGIIGADDALLELENIAIGKEIHGEASRLLNCDNANVDRTIAASEEQLHNIRLIEELDSIDNLPFPLREVAHERLRRPESGLAEIGEALSKPIGKAAVSKRFARIAEVAKRLCKNKTL